MTFVPPSWWMLGLTKIGYLLIPLILGVLLALYGLMKDNILIVIIGVIIVIAGFGLASMAWHNNYEVPSVQEKIITVSDYQIKPNIGKNKQGMIVVDSADDLLLVTTDGESFLNEENFWFGKFNTRDLFNQLKCNGTYKIQYYGWREPFYSTFPNILTVEEVIDESNATNNNFNKYSGTNAAVGGWWF
ncbi:DUF1523 family protein [uncultured Methanobrevibacter sp.]|uniref:DUF1523 family protein n=1 Tax=uncultured Methanobrevibacter sp. TaxID=253161 RepID=UPI0025FF490A|nr:DUF1523 family protein [uncultured Methanobrevibacter sp.]